MMNSFRIRANHLRLPLEGGGTEPAKSQPDNAECIESTGFVIFSGYGSQWA
jgi:hypothetical protein